MSPRAAICTAPGCRQLIPRPGRCPSHTHDPGYQTEHWRTIRAARLTLDQHRCRLAHPGCTERATTVHLDPAARGNHRHATLENTTSACAHCHGSEDAARVGAEHEPTPVGSRNLSRFDPPRHPANSDFARAHMEPNR